MKSAVETLSPTRAKLTVEVPFEELKPSLDAAYKKIAQQINVPGFRRGKVPADGHRPPGRPRRRPRRGDQRGAARSCTSRRCRSNDLEPLAQPEIEVTKFEDNETLEFTAEVDVRPRSSCPTTTASRPRSTTSTVTDAGRRGAGRRRCASASPPSPTSSAPPPTATSSCIDLDGHQGRRGRRGRRGHRHVLPGRPRRHARRPRRGADRHDRRRREDLHLPARRRRPGRRGRRGRRSRSPPVKEQELPELDDEFAQTASEFDTVEELTDDVRERLGARQAPRAGRRRPRRRPREAARRWSRSRCPRRVVDRRAQRPPRATSSSSSRYAGMTMEKYLEDEEQTVEEFEADLEQPGPRRRRRPVRPRRGRQEGGARRRPERAHRAPGAPRPAVRPGPAGVRQPHVRAQPHPGAGVRRSCAARRWPRSSRPRPSPTRPATLVELKNLRPDGTIGEPRRRDGRGVRRRGRPSAPSRGRRRAEPRTPARRLTGERNRMRAGRSARRASRESAVGEQGVDVAVRSRRGRDVGDQCRMRDRDRDRLTPQMNGGGSALRPRRPHLPAAAPGADHLPRLRGARRERQRDLRAAAAALRRGPRRATSTSTSTAPAARSTPAWRSTTP